MKGFIEIDRGNFKKLININNIVAVSINGDEKSGWTNIFVSGIVQNLFQTNEPYEKIKRKIEEATNG